LRRYLPAILLIAVVLRLAFSMGLQRGLMHVAPEREVTDGYNLIAEHYLDGHGYRQFLEHPPTVQRPPGYPVFLLVVFKLAGVNYVVVQILQALLGALGCWLLYELGRWVLSPRLGLAAAALYAVYPNSIEYASRLYSENLFFPLFLAFALLLCRAAWEGSALRGLATGAAWGLATLTRGTLLALPLAIPFGVALSARHRRPASRWLRWSLPALVAAVVVLAPWTARNAALTGSFIPVSSWGWAPFYHGIQCSKHMLAWDDLLQVDREADRRRHQIVVERLYGGDRTKAFASASEYVRHERVARDLVLAELRADPLGAVGRALVGIPFTWFQTYGARMRIVSLAIHLPLMALFVLGAVRMRRSYPEAFARALPALLLIVFVNLFQAVVYPHVRYMSPAVALSFLFAAVPLAEWRLSR
jgi:4-amino-4-deoxy-L-arabinose transferase-like glycosyltransferase